MIHNLGDGYTARLATEADHAALSNICLKTGDAGRDATPREDDGTLIGLIYALPYQVLEPELAFLLEGPDGPAGYVLGARDTKTFRQRAAIEWYPKLQQTVPKPPDDSARWRGSDWARHLIHHPERDLPDALAAFPSHGHIDLLEPARGRGLGRKLIDILARRLAELGSPGLHLQVSPVNFGALEFYRKVGFTQLRADGLDARSVCMVKTLPPT